MSAQKTQAAVLLAAGISPSRIAVIGAQPNRLTARAGAWTSAQNSGPLQCETCQHLGGGGRCVLADECVYDSSLGHEPPMVVL